MLITTRNLFAGYDAGIYTLPDEVAAGWAAFGLLHAARQAPLLLSGAYAGTADEMLEAARTGQPLPDVTAIREAMANDAAAAEWNRALSIATERAASDLTTIALDWAETIVVEHLRPVHTKRVIPALDKAVAAFGDTLPQTVREAMSRHSAAEAKAYKGVQDVLADYEALLLARSDLHRIGYRPVHDQVDVFREGRRIVELHDPIQKNLMSALDAPRTPPWPSDPAGRLVWLAANDAQLWMPTVEEQDEAWLEKYGDGMRAMQRSSFNAQGWRSMGVVA